MTDHDQKAVTTLDVDLTNPGQFFACCGLLELAEATSPGAEGSFGHGTFRLSVAWDELLRKLSTCDLVSEGEPNDKSPPVRLAAPFDLRLDWWREKWADDTKLKTWAGGQTVVGFIDGVRRQPRLIQVAKERLWSPSRLDPYMTLAAEAEAKRDNEQLGQTKSSKKPTKSKKAKTTKAPKPFYFDARLSGLTSLDAGFSTESFAPGLAPAAEVLTLIGLQRFRPETVAVRELYRFHTWNEPLPARVAAAVACGVVPTLATGSYTFPLVFRTGGDYKAFGFAEADKENHDRSR